MKKLYFPLLCFFLFASCSPHLITRGITDKTSNYIVTTAGQHINASIVKIHNDIVSADTASYPLTSVSGIKLGQGYLGVQEGLIYEGVYYGKLMLLRRYSGTTYDMSTHSSHPNYSYFLQKEGQADIVDFNGSNLVDYVQDDPLALRKARASRIYSTISFVSIATTITGIACVFLPYSSPIRKPGVTVGLFSLPTFLITLPIASHKRYKTIVVYNR